MNRTMLICGQLLHVEEFGRDSWKFIGLVDLHEQDRESVSGLLTMQDPGVP